MGGDGPPSLGSTIPLFTINSISLILTFFGNGLIVRAFCKVQSLRTPANSLLVSLAAADLLFGVSFVLELLTCTHEKTTFGCNFHVIQGHVFFTLKANVLLHLAAISLERLVAIKFSLRYITLVTKRRIKIVIAIVWTLGIVLSVLPLILKTTWELSKTDHEDSFEDLFLGSHPPETNDSYRKLICIHSESSETNGKHPSHDFGHGEFFWVSFCTLLLPYIVTIVCHAWIFKISRQHYKRVKAQLESVCPEMNLQMKHAKTTAIVLGSFLLLFTPLVVVVLLKAALKNTICFVHLHIVRIVASQCAWLNPPIYAWKNKDFRKAFSEILKPLCSCLCCCRSEEESQDNPRVPNQEQM